MNFKKRIDNFLIPCVKNEEAIPSSRLIAKVEFALSISMSPNVPFTSKPPLYLSQPLSRILSPRISRNLSKPGLPRSASNEKRFLRIDNAIYYHLIFHSSLSDSQTTIVYFHPISPNNLTVRQHLVVGDLTFSGVDDAELEVHRSFLFLQQ